MMSMNLSDIAILKTKGSDYHLLLADLVKMRPKT